MGIFHQSRARLLFLCCLMAAGYFVYTAVAGALQTHRLTTERNVAAEQVQELQAKQTYLDAVRQYVGSDAYVEQEARRQLGYVRDGEVPFVVISPGVKDDVKPAGDWWQRLFPN